MKPFRFALEALFTLRQRQEQSALEHYARMLLQRQQAMERLRARDHELHEARRAFQQRAADGCSAGRLAQEQRHCVRLDEQCRQAAAQLNAAERTVQQAHQAALHARREREFLERRRELQQMLHDRALARLEQKELDDLVNGRHGLAALYANRGQSPAARPCRNGGKDPA
ncbi:MAG: flagellar FliJ family protein [Verrucomicrobiota bacterium]